MGAAYEKGCNECLISTLLIIPQRYVRKRTVSRCFKGHPNRERGKGNA